MKKARKVFISTNCFQERDPDAILRVCDIYHYKRIELSSVQADEKNALALARRLRSRGVEVLLHNYYPPRQHAFTLNLASQDPDMLVRSREFCLQALDFSAELGAPYYAAHAGFTMDLPPHLLGNPSAQRDLKNFSSRTDCLATLAESLQLLTQQGRRLGVDFLMENHVYAAASCKTASPLLLCWEVEDMISLANMLGSDFALLIDLGHLKVSARSGGFSEEKFLDRVGGWIRAFHLSDNDGMSDEHRSFDGSAWFLPFLQQHDDVPCTLEFDRVVPADISRALNILIHS